MKLNNHAVRYIRLLSELGEPDSSLSRAFGVTSAYIRLIVNGSARTKPSRRAPAPPTYKGRKLTRDELESVYQLAHNSRMTQREIGDLFGITSAYVSQIKKRKDLVG